MNRGADKPFSRSYACGEGAPALLGRCIGEMLDRSAAVYPDGDALIVRHQNLRYTWQQFLHEVELTARGLLRLGVKKGDRVGIWSTNCAEWIVLQFATAKAGAILVNINPANRAFELEYVLRQSECQALVLGEGFRDCDYAETLQTICPEFASSSRGSLRSEKLPHLSNVIFLGARQAPEWMYTWRELLDMAQEIRESVV